MVKSINMNGNLVWNCHTEKVLVVVGCSMLLLNWLAESFMDRTIQFNEYDMVNLFFLYC